MIAAALMVTLSTAFGQPSNPPEVSTKDYQKASFCKACHKDNYAAWEQSMHANASTDPLYRGAFELASKETDGLTDGFCSTCHTPIGRLAGEIPPADHSNVSDIADEGVQCDFCHTMTGHEGIGNGRYLVEPGKNKRGPFDDCIDAMAHESVKSDFHTKPEFCGTCHDVSHPVNGLPLETTFAEWQAGPYNVEGEDRRICQDCHMTPGPNYTKNPGKASDIGEEREHIWTHQFAGGGGVSSLLGHEQTMANATARLQAAAEMEVIAPESVQGGTDAEIQVAVTNVGCGHSLPTGVTEMRDLWIELIVADAAGKQIFTSGEVDDEGYIAEGAVKYGVIVADAEGNPTPKFWLAASKISDHRIPPKETVTETYTVAVPEGAAGPLTVTARLRYRAAGPEVMSLALPEFRDKSLPIIEMTSAQGEMAVGG